MIQVEIAYALSANEQYLKTVKVMPNSTIQDVIRLSSITDYYPEIDLDKQPVGIFGQKKDLMTRVEPGDRVEIYRPLLIDPKEARRQRIKQERYGSS